jgi:hypothetical protein
MEAGGVGRARDMGMSSSDRQGQLVRERERERAGARARWHVGQWRQWHGALMHRPARGVERLRADRWAWAD